MNGVVLFVRVVVSLGIVLGLLWFAARMLRNRGIAPNVRKLAADARIEVIDRKGLSKNAAIAVVRVAGQHLIVGVTDHQITTLGIADDAAFETEPRREERVALSIIDPLGDGSPAVVETAEVANWTADSATGTDGMVTNRTAWMGLLDVMRERTVRRV